jgi:spoIIIJ-associated protein
VSSEDTMTVEHAETPDSAAEGSAEASTEAGAGAGSGAGSGTSQELLVREGDIAADYLEQLLDIIDFDGDIDLDVENGRAIVAIVGEDLRGLVGGNGATLDALQELVRLAVQQKTGVRSRLMLDVGGHREHRRTQLAELARSTAITVRETGEPARLTAMNPFERKVIHDVIAGITGVRSESEGEEPQRRVVVHPGD